MKYIDVFGKRIGIKCSVMDKPISDSVIELYSTYKISVMLTDGLAAIVGDKIFVGNKYDIFFFRPDEIHFGRFLRSGIHKYIDFYIPTDFFDILPNGKTIKSFLEDKDEDRINAVHTESLGKRVSDLTGEMLELTENDTLGHESELLSVILQMLIICHRLYEKQKKERRVSAPPIVSRTLSYIDIHFSEKITVKEIAAEMGCSEAYLSRVFRQYTGASVYKHITDMRISYAKRMLSGGAGVTEACFACGFEDCSNFINTFKRTVGMTPLKYKKRG